MWCWNTLWCSPSCCGHYDHLASSLKVSPRVTMWLSTLRMRLPQSPVVLRHVILITACIFQVARAITIRLRSLTFQGSLASSCMGWYTSLTTCSLAGNTRLFSLCMEAHRLVDAFSLSWLCDVIMFLCPLAAAVYTCLERPQGEKYVLLLQTLKILVHAVEMPTIHYPCCTLPVSD